MTALVEGRLDPHVHDATAAHVDACPTCRELLAEWARLFGGTREDEPRVVAAPERGTEVGHYVVEGYLARGGRGVAYLARDVRLDREVVLKFSTTTAGKEASAREATALAALAHPNVVRVYDLGVWSGRPYLAMESVDGVDLRRWTAALPPGRASASAVLRVLAGVASGLSALHRAGIVHRDVKPENVLVDAEGTARIIDLDLAHREAGCRAPNVAGTPAYMAPEAFRGEPPTPACDVYGFSRTALDVLGIVPVLRSRERDHARLRAHVPARLVRLLRKGTADAPDERPSLAAIADALTVRPSSARVRVAVAFALSLAILAAVVIANAETGPSVRRLAPGACSARGVFVASSAPGAPRSAIEARPASVGAPTGRAITRAPATTASPHPAPARERGFDRALATQRVKDVDVRRCSASSGRPLRVSLFVTFGPSGAVEHVHLRTPLTSPRGSCVLGLFRAVRVPPYVGFREDVERSFTVVEDAPDRDP